MTVTFRREADCISPVSINDKESLATFRRITLYDQMIAAQLMSNLLETVKGTPVYTQAIEVFTTLSSNIEQDSNLNAKKLSNRILFLGMNPVESGISENI